MDKNIGFCGYDCSRCAARSQDPEARRKLVEAWRKVFGHQNYTVENVLCAGCRHEGPHADAECQARPCALAKGIESCAECDEFPCRKMATLACDRASVAMFCHKGVNAATEEEFETAAGQFICSRQNLLQVLKEKGKLPDWF